MHLTSIDIAMLSRFVELTKKEGTCQSQRDDMTFDK